MGPLMEARLAVSPAFSVANKEMAITAAGSQWNEIWVITTILL